MKKLMMTSDEYYHRHDNEAPGCECWVVAFIVASVFWVGLYLILR